MGGSDVTYAELSLQSWRRSDPMDTVTVVIVLALVALLLTEVED